MITPEQIEATRARLRNAIWTAMYMDVPQTPEAALDALIAFERAEVLASMPCQAINCYVESDPERYAANPHRICEVHEARIELQSIIDRAGEQRE